MDVLFGSIDVRELLSSQEVEETSPLSAPDLRLLIDKLQIRSLQIKDKVSQYIRCHRQDFSTIFSRCSESAIKVDEISTDLPAILQLLDHPPFDVELRDLATEICQKMRDLKEKKEALAVVRILSNLLERLRSVKEDVKCWRLLEAARGVRDLQKALGIPDKWKEEEIRVSVDGKEPDAFVLLRREWIKSFDQLQEVFAGITESYVKFEGGKENARVRVRACTDTGPSNGIDLPSVLTAMEIVGILDYGLAKVADSMIKHVIIFTVKNESASVFVEELNPGTDEKAEAILNLISPCDIQIECLDGVTIYSRLIEVIQFIYDHICFQNRRWMSSFGRLMWPRISQMVITCFLSKAVPDDASKIAGFQNILKLTTEFETRLKEMMFISASANDERLSTFAQNVEVHFATRKKNEILAKTRKLLLQCEFVLSQENARQTPFQGEGSFEYTVDLLFHPERCLVSKAASQLAELVHATLQDVCLSSPRVSLEFYHAARDALLLYDAIVPVKLEKQLDSISQAAVIVHNDCLYLSQEILGLAFEYRSDFPSDVQEHAVFIDIAASFHQMGEEILQKQIQLVNLSLKEAMDGAHGFQNTHQMQQYESGKFSIDQVVFILEKVHIIWQPLLLPVIYKRTMCAVLDSVFTRMAKDILLLDDMAVEETLQLQRLIHMALENLSSLFQSLADEVEKRGKLSEHIWDQLDKMIPSLCKLRKLADLLDMPLQSITMIWESGELVSCGFTSSEVQNFIKAIFTDSPLRKECLWRIGSRAS